MQEFRGPGIRGEGRARAILIAGPTASGKSALALAIAERTGGLVVNADALQVYRELRILTARPTVEEEARAEHRLYGHVPADEVYSVARWLADVSPVLAEAAAGGRPAIVVGGTGLYFEALTRGLAAVPEIPDAVREKVRQQAACLGPVGLHARLAARDLASAARLRDSDPQRLMRALEVFEATGRSLTEWQAEPPPPPLLPEPAVRVVIAPDRAWLHARIAERFEAMVAAGGLDEAVVFASRGLDPALPAMRAIGVAPLAAAARGEVALEEAVRRAVVDTRRYAKRQETWFRNRMGDWGRIEPRNIGEAADAISQHPEITA
jgi:tRNA dimethylallyltransferase